MSRRMLGLALVAALLGAAIAPGSSQAGRASEATPSALFLTFPEAKRQIRGRLRRDARITGDRLEYAEVNRCRGYSARRVRCFYYAEDTSGIVCQGRMQVIEFPFKYRTQGFGTRCF